MAKNKNNAQAERLQTELFRADLTEWPCKDDLHSMAHPIFAIRKSRSTEIRSYTDGDRTVKIIPSAIGPATIWDKDLLLFAGSQILEGVRLGRAPSRAVLISTYDFLDGTERSDSGTAYKNILDMLRRLKGTYLEGVSTANTESGVKEKTKSFSLIEDYEITRESKTGKIAETKVTLSEWLYSALLTYDVLTIDHGYFKLEGGLDRRLYELGRKHLGKGLIWKCDLVKLMEKCGSECTPRRFRFELRKIIQADDLPRMRIAIDGKDNKAVFYTRDNDAFIKYLADNALDQWFFSLDRAPS